MIQNDPLSRYIDLQLRETQRRMTQRHIGFFRFPIDAHASQKPKPHGWFVRAHQLAIWPVIHDYIARILIRLGCWHERP